MTQSLLENYQGKLLIAHPKLPVGNPFKETVIYVTQDTDDHTIGLILNLNSQRSMQRERYFVSRWQAKVI